MKLIGPIITSILLIYVRIWIINTIFSQQKIKIHITIKIFGLSFILVWLLFAYKYVLWMLWQENLTLTNNINTKSIILFISYIIIFATTITIFFKNRYKTIIQILFIWSLFFITIAYGGLLIWINTILLYYIIAAYAEEYIKYSTGNNVFLANKETNQSNLIFFCVLIWLWFSTVENIFYMIHNIVNNENTNIVHLLMGRGLVSTLIHIVSTSAIALIMIKTKNNNNIIIAIILGIIVGVWIHSIYNISLQYNLSYITIPLIIGILFLMSYITFQSDIIYKSSNK